MEGKALAQLADSLGYSVVGNACTRNEATKMWEAESPDLCIYDDASGETSGSLQWLPGVIQQRPLPLILASSELRPETCKQLAPHAYLFKPLTAKALNQAVRNSVINFDDGKSDAPCRSETLTDRVFIRDVYNNYTRLMLDSILWAKGEGNYTRIVTSEKQFVVRMYLGDFLKTVPGEGFVRAHKSYLINLCAVEEIRPTNVLISETEIPLAKSYRKEILLRFSKY